MNKSTHKRKVRVFNLDLGLTSLGSAAYSIFSAAWQLNAGSPCLVWTLGSPSWPIAIIPKWSVCSCGRNWRPEPKEHLRTSVRSTWTSTGPTGTTSCSCTATTSSKFGAAAWVECRGAKWPGTVWPGGRRVGGVDGAELRSSWCDAACALLCLQAAGSLPRPHGVLHVQHGESAPTNCVDSCTTVLTLSFKQNAEFLASVFLKFFLSSAKIDTCMSSFPILGQIEILLGTDPSQAKLR